jgi:chaperone modulatory protein CbpM
MSISEDDVLAYARIDRATLELWIGEHWIAPETIEDARVFSEIDLARARLIGELIEDLGVNEAGVGVVLDLLDQVHNLRRLIADLGQGRAGA